MDFSITDEQKALRDLAKDFAKNEMIPKAEHHDHTGEYPKEILKKAFDVGLMNMHIPVEYGGSGLGVLDELIASEELFYGCSGMATAILANNLALAPVLLGADDYVMKKFIQPMTENFTLAAYAVTEPGAGSDVAGIRTTAKRVGDEYIINGSKMWITNAGHADWFFVLAKTDPNAGHKGMTGFIVDAKSPGIIVGKKEKNMGQRCSDTRGVTFEDVKVPKENMIGKEGEGFKIAMGAFDQTRPAVAIGAVGVARAALDHSIRYANTRNAFGKPISVNQGVSFMIAEMARDIEAGRLLCWQSAWLIDNKFRNTYQASIAKVFCADMAMRVTTDAVQIFGGYGFNEEYPVEKLMRDAKIFQIYEGTSQIQRVIISKFLNDGVGIETPNA
ncbi:acyl-CoA dehydrogenase family protein [Leptospira bandrabouensis]|uniref:Acyl-CoA dehydrogenase family protein n=1 Tax=Leptospira soteropolitanensis TaxID=2950025 RepID=A0AAW5VKP2_9LEPT|nr:MULTISPECIES: acyl-CoA dehydrogenase family protein [Leptospira]MCG6143912.1 acyl-CoA dehydrogenase family protein [Leptospira bandrabouensis]MCG6151047.1 acyl-CoA dehydrogenase family protein [Leptospira bandrabouensis]MCG6159573.1 acyl-CoA dehydrogenase family protein [Leptospira bandrabouensis]MCG6163506.1 acyl-CoA dehydrogenase family protein [Leptospira bandrabouensis]MCW7457425.1 acyl-CoA dehydrogenase family protein [Leptospira bandrabouensis]